MWDSSGKNVKMAFTVKTKIGIKPQGLCEDLKNSNTLKNHSAHSLPFIYINYTEANNINNTEPKITFKNIQQSSAFFLLIVILMSI